MTRAGERVHVFAIGSAGAGVDVPAAARLVNASQRHFRLFPSHTVPVPEGHSDIVLDDETVFQSFPEAEEVQIAVTINALQDNYFSRRRGSNKAVISCYQIDEACERAGRTETEFVAQAAVTQWLQLKLRSLGGNDQGLWHRDTRACIFDFVEDKTMIRHKLQGGHVCGQCEEKLLAAGLAKAEVEAAERVLKRIQVPTPGRATRDALANPVFSLLVGGVIGGLAVNLASAALAEGLSTTSWWILIAILGVGAIVIAGNYALVRHRYAESRL